MPDSTIQIDAIPDDPGYDALWGLRQIDGPAAWDLTTGSRSVVVGVIDSGVNYQHPDLADNAWRNPGEIPDDGIDNDSNGFIDDVYGWDFARNDNSPLDANGHGTHVAGTIGAVGNNAEGVTGVAWDVSIMALRFLDGDGFGSSSDAIRAINYATMMRQQFGQNVVATNNSWSGGLFSTAMRGAIQSAGESGILFVAAAGNSGVSSERFPEYPAAYDLPSIVSVAASDSNDALANFSNYGVTSVDLAAPGVSIESTFGSGYDRLSGTSMAAPHVTGVAALAWAANPASSLLEVRDALFAGVDPVPSFEGLLATGGRLNARSTLERLVSEEPVASDDLASTFQGQAVTFDALANDFAGIDGAPLTIQSVQAPAFGEVTVNADQTLTYRPASDFLGRDVFEYVAANAQGLTTRGLITIEVTLPREEFVFTSSQRRPISFLGPHLVGSELFVHELSGAVIDLDVQIDIDHTYVADLEITLTSPQGHRLSLVENRGGSGEDFRATIFDDDAGSSVADGRPPFTGRYRPEEPLDVFNRTSPVGTWILEVDDQVELDGGALNEWSLVFTTEEGGDLENRPPLASDDAFTLDEDASVTVDPLANDVDPDGHPLIIHEVESPANGEASIVNGRQIEYTPDPNFFGQDSLVYTIEDPAGAVSSATIVFTVVEVNDAPAAVADSFATLAGSSIVLDVLKNDTDVDGDVLRVVDFTSPQHGQLTLGDTGQLTYLPDSSFRGADEFNYTIDDGRGGRSSAAVQIDVQGNETTTFVANERIVISPNGRNHAISSLQVEGLAGQIANIEVGTQILHEYVGDLRITLISPEEKRVILFDSRGHSADDLRGTVFDDAAAEPIAFGQAPYAGRYRPEQELSTLRGSDPNGVWRLDVYDREDSDGGELQQWWLTFQLAIPAATANAVDSPVAVSATRLGGQPQGQQSQRPASAVPWMGFETRQATPPAAMATEEAQSQPAEDRIAAFADWVSLDELFGE